MANQVLVVEDDVLVRRLIKRNLERHGYRVDTAENGIEAMECMKSVEYPVVITDLIMPDQDGIETIFMVGRESPKTKIIAITGGGRTGDPDYFLRVAETAGAFCTLAKPFKVTELIEKIREALGQQVA